jgi:PncC family amidohydrolase
MTKEALGRHRPAVANPFSRPAEPAGLAEELGRLLTARELTLALAESCTGGLIGNLITDVSGSSSYFLGSAVTYAYSAKEAILGVRHETLITYGAVSPQTATEMARGARRIFGSDVAVAVTGIAGPTGGMPGKPVGLVHIHLSAADAEIDQRFVWASDRIGNKRLTAEAVLRLLIGYLETRKGQGAPPSPPPLEEQATSLPEFVDETVLVEAHLQPGGDAEPQAFTWRGHTYAIADTGRQWQEEHDGRTWHCYLVRTAALETFELRLNVDSAHWILARAWPPRPGRAQV